MASRVSSTLLLGAALILLSCTARDGPNDWAPDPEIVPVAIGASGSEPLSFKGVVYRIPVGQVLGEVRLRRRVVDEMRWTVPRTHSLEYNVAVTDGLRGYADYMATDAFKRGVTQLLGLAGRSATAMMCAEREPLHCHRSLIADYLTLQGVEVVHLLEPGQSHPHQLRPEVRRESQQLIYDRYATAELPLK